MPKKTSSICSLHVMAWIWQNKLNVHFNTIFGMCGNGLPIVYLRVAMILLASASWNVLCSKSVFPASLLNILLILSCMPRWYTQTFHDKGNNLWVFVEWPFNSYTQRTNPQSVKYWHHLGLFILWKWSKVDFK